MESKQDNISEIITDGFVKAMETAQASGMPAGEFKTIALQTLMGNFIATCELGMENIPQHIRMEIFKKEIAEFESAGLAIFMKLVKEEKPALILSTVRDPKPN